MNRVMKHKLKWSPSLNGTATCTVCGAKVRHTRGGPRGGTILVYKLPGESKWIAGATECKPVETETPWTKLPANLGANTPTAEVDSDTAFIPPFGTVRVCRGCGCLVAGGPTSCRRCAEET